MATQPGERPLDHPAMSAEALARFDALARDPELDVPAVQEPAAARAIVRLVSMQLGGSLAALAGWLAAHGHGVDQVGEERQVNSRHPVARLLRIHGAMITAVAAPSMGYHLDVLTIRTYDRLTRVSAPAPGPTSVVLECFHGYPSSPHRRV